MCYQPEPIETIEYKNHTIKIWWDDDPIDPVEEYDMFGTIACWHNHYKLGHEQVSYEPWEWLRNLACSTDETLEDGLWYWEDGPGWSHLINQKDHRTAIDLSDHKCRALINKALDKHFVMLPLYLYDHSGITMRCAPFPCPWDSGQVGFIYVSIAEVKEEFGWRRLTKKRRAQIETYLKGTVETYDYFLTGQYYGYTIGDDEDEPCDSCRGLLGDIDYAIEMAKESVDYGKTYKNSLQKQDC